MTLWRRALGLGLVLSAVAAVVLVALLAGGIWLLLQVVEAFGLGPTEG